MRAQCAAWFARQSSSSCVSSRSAARSARWSMFNMFGEDNNNCKKLHSSALELHRRPHRAVLRPEPVLARAPRFYHAGRPSYVRVGRRAATPSQRTRSLCCSACTALAVPAASARGGTLRCIVHWQGLKTAQDTRGRPRRRPDGPRGASARRSVSARAQLARRPARRRPSRPRPPRGR